MSLNNDLQERFSHLEVCTLKLSEVRKDNESFRIDSEYFKKEYLENEERLKNLKINCEHLENLIVKISGGATPLGAEYEEVGIPFLRVQNIMQNYFNLDDVVYISTKDDEELKRGRLKLGDVLLTITGAYGKSAVVEQELVGANINQHSVKMEVKDINPYFLATFLNSKFGKLQSDKKITGITRPALDYKVIKTFLIPILPMSFQLEIERLVKESHTHLEQSKALYKEAEELLYEALGLDATNPLQSIQKTQKFANISTLKESFLKTGRLDSEYYQSKYEDLESFIKSYHGGYWRLDPTEIKDSNVTPKNGIKYRYIELANIGSKGDISEPMQELGENLPTRARRIVKEGDLIISSVEGSLNSCALITKEFDSCFVSTGFYVLRTKCINSQTLLVLFKSQFFQAYLKKFPSGTILSAISKEEVLNILIPKIDANTQAHIARYIQESLSLRAEARELLKEAKDKLEKAIENKDK